jgi:hypothetical protein
MSSAAVLSAFVQEGNIVSICCSTGEVLLDILKVIITASLLASLTYCQTSCDSSYDATLAVCLAGAFRSSIKKKRHLYTSRFNIKELGTELTECVYVLLVMFKINSGNFP